MRRGLRQRRGALWVLATAAAQLLAAPPAHADLADDCAAAAEHAAKLRRRGQLSAARSELETCVRPACPGIVREDCETSSREVDAALASVTVHVVDADGNAVTDFVATVDGRPLPVGPDGRTPPIDPGAHSFRFERPPSSPIVQIVNLGQGEKDRAVSIRFGSIPGQRQPVPAVAWVLGGAGVIGLGIGIGFWTAGLSSRSDLLSTCGPTHSCASSDVDASRSKLIVGDVVAGAGVLLLAAGLALAIYTTASAPAKRGPSARAASSGRSAALVAPF